MLRTARSVVVITTLAAMLTGCSSGSETLLIDRSASISKTGAETKWSSNGEDISIERYNFSAQQPLLAVQEFNVADPARVLLTTDDAVELPGGVDLNYTIRQDGEFVKGGQATELLIRPTTVELRPGKHTLEMEISPTYEYQNIPSTGEPVSIQIPRIIMEES